MPWRSASPAEKTKQSGLRQSWGRARPCAGRAAFSLAEGARLCADAAISGVRIREAYFTDRAAEKYAAYLEPILRAAERSFAIAEPVASLLACTDANQGVFCVCEKRTRQEMQELPPAHCLALETVQDPGNLGAALRTAEALGIGSVLLAGECCDVYAPKVLRASMGAVFRLPVFFCESLPETLPKLSARGFSSCAAVPDADAVPVTRADFSRPCVMAVGMREMDFLRKPSQHAAPVWQSHAGTRGKS